MEALEAIQKRRSVRKFTGDIVPRADLEKIVDAGRLAATGSNRQPWDFIVVTDREYRSIVSAWLENGSGPPVRSLPWCSIHTRTGGGRTAPLP